jgi:DNA-binding response OmpR family regulator
MVPLKSGFEVLKELRDLDYKTPVIFLTAKEDLESKEI